MSATFSRRSVLRGAALGAGALALPAVLSACSGGGSGGKTVRLGSNYSDPIPRKALAAAVAAYQTKSKKTVKINTVDHNTFQQRITSYLKGSPDDVFAWFAGNRMKFFAKQGLAVDLSDIWKDLTSHFPPAFKKASTADDGKQYFVPLYNYPWAVWYRPSLFKAKGYQPPKTLDDMLALCKKMKTDGLIPIALGEKDGWPAMGTFDQINLRTNGYDFHISLMDGKQSWTDPKVKQVFDTWRGLLEYSQPGANGRTWQEAGQSLQARQTAMFVAGSQQITQQFQGADANDLDFFPYPVINQQYGQDAVEAPIDGFMVANKAKDKDAAKDFVKFLATAAAENAYIKLDPSNLAAAKDADTSGYNALQKKCAEYIAGAKQISQFMDRDTRPDFAQTVMIPSLQQFVANPGNADSIMKSIEQQKKTIFAND